MKHHRQVITLCLVIGLLLALSLPLWAEESQQININTATAAELTQLKGVGTKYAERIVQYREEHGPFASAEDMMKVPGIGPRTCEVNKERIVVE
jgi:competence protein ComEA